MGTCENQEELIRLIRVQKQALERLPEDLSCIGLELTSLCAFPLHSQARICASGKQNAERQHSFYRNPSSTLGSGSSFSGGAHSTSSHRSWLSSNGVSEPRRGCRWL